MPALYLAQVGTAEASGTLGTVLRLLEEEHRQKARRSWMLLSALVAGLVLLGVLAAVAYQILSSWIEVFRAQDRQIQEILR
jgi:hypothetical protein